MLLGLKETGDLMRTVLRPVIRKAAKEGIECHAVVEGLEAQGLSFDMSESGPVWERGETRVSLYLRRENRFAALERSLAPAEEPDEAAWLEELRAALDEHSCLVGPVPPVELEFLPPPQDAAEERLLNVSVKEMGDYFRSRFLMDAPNRLVYDGELSRGLRIQGHLGASGAPLVGSFGYFILDASLRAGDCHLRFHLSGNSLRDLRMASIRRRLSPCWKAEAGDTKSPQPALLLGSAALARLARATLFSVSGGNRQLWQWMQRAPLAGQALRPKTMPPEGSPVGDALRRHFEFWQYPGAEMEEPLENLLEGRSKSFSEALYVHDLSGVAASGERLLACSRGSVFVLAEGGPPLRLPGNVSFALDGTTLAAQKSTSSTVKAISADPVSAIATWLAVPDYMLLDPVRLVNFAVDRMDGYQDEQA